MIFFIVKCARNAEEQNMDVYGIIMAGGGGSRFWPLSRQATPKQLLNLTGKDLMVNETLDRMGDRKSVV